MAWTEERVALLRKLWLEKRSAAEIAAELGGTTRNAVIGKAYREGLSQKKSDITAKNPASQSGKPTKQAKPKVSTKTVQSKLKNDKTETFEDTPNLDNFPEQTPVKVEDPASIIESARRSEKASPRLSLMELTENTCKWPIGDPAQDEFWFCGHPSELGKPYCEPHNKIAAQPFTAKSHKKPSATQESNANQTPQQK